MEQIQDVTQTNRAHLFAKRYKKTATIRAIKFDFPFQVQSKEGLLNGNAGDWLAIADDDSPEQPHRWIISAVDFGATYEECEAI